MGGGGGEGGGGGGGCGGGGGVISGIGVTGTPLTALTTKYAPPNSSPYLIMSSSLTIASHLTTIGTGLVWGGGLPPVTLSALVKTLVSKT